MQKPRVLLVDDKPENLFALEGLLGKLNLETISVTSGVEALKVSAREDLALILLDVQMPDMDGFQTAEFLRSNKKTEHIPIIFVTAIDRDQQFAFKGYESGAVDFLFKPIDSNIIKSKVSVFIAMYRQKQQLSIKAEELNQTNNELQQSLELIKVQQTQINDELEQALHTQMSMMPQTFPEIPHAKTASRFSPMETIGGDFYDIFMLRGHLYGVLIADVTGHGIPAALLSFMIYSTFTNSAYTRKPPGEVITMTNDLLIGKLQKGKFASMFYGIYDTDNNIFTYSNGGHPPVLVIRPETEEVLELGSTGPIVGALTGIQYKEETCQLLPGDKVFLYTDGITEARNKQGDMLGISGLQSFLLQHSHASIEQVINRTYDFVHEFNHASVIDDDVTMIGFEIEGS